jgi:hypothetical protein
MRSKGKERSIRKRALIKFKLKDERNSDVKWCEVDGEDGVGG